MKSRIQVFEHQVLRIGEQGFTEADFDALVLFNQRHADRVLRRPAQQSEVHELRRRAAGRRTHHRGAAQGRPSTEVGGEQKWHRALIDMLQGLRVPATGGRQLGGPAICASASLFDLYMEAFLTDVERLLHHGLVKKYRQVVGNVTALKGRLIFSRDIAENLVHRERFLHGAPALRPEQPLQPDSAACGLHRGGDVARRRTATSRRDATHLDGGHRRHGRDGADVSRLAFDRNTERYRPAVALARLIILNYQPDVRRGGHDVLAILFDMNELFEKYILRQLKTGRERVCGPR